MSKGIYLGIGNDLGEVESRKVKNVWIKINGVLKQKIIPRGLINGSLKDFISYYIPQIFVNTGIAYDTTGFWMTKFDETLQQIFKINMTGTKPTDYNTLAYTFINDDEETTTSFTNYGNILQKRNVEDGSLIKSVGNFNTRYDMETQMYRYENLLFHHAGQENNELYIMDMKTNSLYCPKLVRNFGNKIKGLIADNAMIYTSYDWSYNYNSSMSRFIYTQDGVIINDTVSIVNNNIIFFSKVGYKIFCICYNSDQTHNVINSTIQIRNGGSLGTVEKEIEISTGQGYLSAIYDYKKKVIYAYSSKTNTLKTLDLEGNILKTKLNVLTNPHYSYPNSEISDCDENGNLYFIERTNNAVHKTNLVICNSDGVIINTKELVNANMTNRAVNITASRYKNRYGELL